MQEGFATKQSKFDWIDAFTPHREPRFNLLNRDVVLQRVVGIGRAPIAVQTADMGDGHFQILDVDHGF